jgi:hypothetical protein
MAVALSETMNTSSQRADRYGRLVLRGDCIRTRIAIQRSLRCLGERGFALLTGRWCTLQHITASPAKSATSPAPRSSSPHLSTATSHENRWDHLSAKRDPFASP